jgi:hypothetical protein
MPVRAAIAFLALLLLFAPASAEILPTLPLRELIVRAPVVVLAEPIDKARPGHFRVQEVLKGQAPRVGAEIEFQGLENCLNPGEQPEWARIDSAILFLRPTGDGRLELIESGLRLHTRDGAVMWPVQLRNPGGFRMIPQPGLRWDALLERARSDSFETIHLRSAAELADPRRRNTLLLDWVERHRTDFTDGRNITWMRLSPAIRNFGSEGMDLTDFDANGWGELQFLPFTRVLQSGVPDDCWRATNLYAELNHGELPAGATAAFANRAGRQLLLMAAKDGHQLDGRRARALRLLADPWVLSNSQSGADERSELLDGLLPILKDRNAACRGLAVQGVARIAAVDKPSPERVLKALRIAYRSEEPGPVRNACAESFYELAGPQAWKNLSGHSAGYLSLIRDLEVRDDKLYFWVTLKTDPLVLVKQPPEVVIDHVDAEGRMHPGGKIALVALPRAGKDEGWRGIPLLTDISHQSLKPGKYRLRVQGVAGDEKLHWESELRTFEVVVPSAPRQPAEDQSPLGNLIRSFTLVPKPVTIERGMVTPDNKAKRVIVLDGDAF